MYRLIDQEALMREIDQSDRKYGITIANKLNFKAIVQTIPCIEAKPARRGKWSEHFKRPCSIMFDCSECGGIAYDVQKNKKQPKRCTYRYCPHCGAKMDGGSNEG